MVADIHVLRRPALELDWLEYLINLDPEEEEIIRDLDGALNLLVQHIVRSAPRPQPMLALGASLAALGALMGHRFKSESNLRSNLYVLNLAPSSAGKDHGRKSIKEALIAADLEEYLGGERIASGAGLMSALVRHPALLFQIDEFGKFANAICDKRGQKHQIEIWDRLTELFTSAGGTWLGTEYANQELRPRERIIEPCLCIHGTTVAETFWKALQHGAAFDGSLARFLLFQASWIPDTQHGRRSETDVPAELIAGLRAIAGADEPAALPGSPKLHDTRVIPMTPEAREQYYDLDRDITERLRRNKENRAILGRWCEHAIKVAMIAAVSANPQDPIINEQHFEWAQMVVANCVENLLQEAEDNIADNEIEADRKMVLKKIRETGAVGITLTDLSRKTQKLNRRTRNEILAELGDAELIEIERYTAPKAKRQTLRLTAK